MVSMHGALRSSVLISIHLIDYQCVQWPMNGFVEDGMSTEVDSLQRRVKSLSRALAVAQREHREELAVKETALFSGISKREKLQKLNVQPKASKSELEASVKAHATAASAAEAEILTLNTENKRLCSVAKRMKARISDLEAELAARPDANLRMRVKSLCKKYHSDKRGSAAAFEAEEVARDLIDLLNDQCSVP